MKRFGIDFLQNMIKIKYTKNANKDLDKIFITIYKDKPTSAKEYLLKMKAYVELLGTNPFMGQDCHEKGLKKECRVLVYDKHYMIVYKVYTRHISIQRILNTKQNYKG